MLTCSHYCRVSFLIAEINTSLAVFGIFTILYALLVNFSTKFNESRCARIIIFCLICLNKYFWNANCLELAKINKQINDSNYKISYIKVLVRYKVLVWVNKYAVSEWKWKPKLAFQGFFVKRNFSQNYLLLNLCIDCITLTCYC